MLATWFSIQRVWNLIIETWMFYVVGQYKAAHSNMISPFLCGLFFFSGRIENETKHWRINDNLEVKNDLTENMLKIPTREKNKNISDVLLMAIQEINDRERERESGKMYTRELKR